MLKKYISALCVSMACSSATYAADINLFDSASQFSPNELTSNSVASVADVNNEVINEKIVRFSSGFLSELKSGDNLVLHIDRSDKKSVSTDVR